MLLVDASVWAALVDPRDRYHADAHSIVLDLPRGLAALDLTLYEIANAVGAKKGETDGARHLSQLILTRCRDRLLTVDADLLDATVGIAAEHNLTAYDAAYVAAARRHGMTLVSADVRDLVSKGLAVAPDAALYP